MTPVTDPDDLAGLFEADRETHLYGLADLEEPFWSNSTWYRDGQAAVGLVGVGDDWVTGYAMSRVAGEASLALLGEMVDGIPPGTLTTGPTGMFESMSKVRSTKDLGPHWRMILKEPVAVEGSTRAVSLGPDDLDAVADLRDSDPGSAFFLPAMLSENPFVGIWEDGRLLAMAGTHVVSKRFGVAAIGGVITRPSHRGQGLGTMVMSAICERLVGVYETIGLNVEVFNESALRIYDQTGFRRVFQYEEVEVL